MIVRWLTSRAARKAIEFRRRALKTFRIRQDILNADERERFLRALAELDFSIVTGFSKKRVLEKLAAFETVTREVMPVDTHERSRENVEVVLMSLIVAATIRTFFFQPFKIPTASMQPTLYGTVFTDLRQKKDFTPPTGFKYWARKMFYGETYYRLVSQVDGPYQNIEPPGFAWGFIPRQRIKVGDVWHTLWFPPEDGISPTLIRRGGREFNNREYHKGDDIVFFKSTSGDHLFADRLSYNFRKPRRGEIVVFETHGIPKMPRDQQDQYFIKRLVGLPGESMIISNDHHVIVNGKRLDASTPHFENVYTFKVRTRSRDYREGEYSGHWNDRHRPGLAPLFVNEFHEYKVKPDNYAVLGDNSISSYDSRTWGDLPQENLIGKAWFVYWPYSDRFGIGYR